MGISISAWVIFYSLYADDNKPVNAPVVIICVVVYLFAADIVW